VLLPLDEEEIEEVTKEVTGYIVTVHPIPG
jgi:hypothetical protein